MCKVCYKVFTKKSVYNYHINRKNPCIFNGLNINDANVVDYMDDTTCLMCGKKFATKQNTIRHIKESCKRINLINANNNCIKNVNLNDINNEKVVDDFVLKLAGTPIFDQIIKKINDLSNKNKNEKNINIVNNINNINNINNNTIDNSINIKIKICPLGNEMKAGLVIPDNELVKIMNKGFMSPVQLIEFTHFNEQLPQFQNIYIPNIRENYIRIYNGKKWITRDKIETITDLLIAKTEFISDKYDELKSSDAFKKSIRINIAGALNRLFDAVNNTDDPRIMDLKKEIQCILYDNRDIPINNHKKLKHNK